MTMTVGRFITIEGGEGVGKSTNLAFVEQFLMDRGLSVLVTREPGGTELGERLRALLLEHMHDAPVPMAELLMIFAARAQHLTTVIEPALVRGEWVLCDRFTDATYAYQGAGRGVDVAVIEQLEALVQGCRRPDATLLLDVVPEMGLARAGRRGSLDRFEREEVEFFERVRQGYLNRSRRDPGRWRVVDAGQSLDCVQTDLAHALTGLLSEWLSC